VAGSGNFDKKDKSPKTWQVSELDKIITSSKNVAGYGNFDKKDKSPGTWQVMETLTKKTSPQERGRFWKL
jgi:hypothetical protein